MQAKYGFEKVCQIATFQTLGVKSIIKSLGKSLGMTYEQTDKMTKEVPDSEVVEEKNEEGIITQVEKKIELLSQLEKYDFFKQLISSDENVAQLFEIGKVLEGLPSTTGKHAAGVIIGRKNIMNYMPLMEVDGIMVSQFEKRASEDIGMLKMDFLGLQTLDILMETKRLINEYNHVNIDFNKIPLDDQDVFKNIFQTGNTGKVFQFESGGMRSLLKDIHPTSLADLCAANAAYRPGPMQFIPDFIEGKKHPEKVKYPTKEYEQIASETMGILFYQEQVMQIVQAMAGFTLGEADILRRGIGKKVKKYIDDGREKFVAGCQKLGTADEETAKYIYSTIEKFANYGFNKSHSDAYGLVAYWCAWLKYHYPEHFMAANCTIASTDSVKLLSCIREVQSMNLPLLPPDLKYSKTKFSLEKTDDNKIAIRMSLSAITSIRDDTANAIISLEDKSSLYKIVMNLPHEDVNKRQLTSIIASGAMDYLEQPRKGLIETLPVLLEQKKMMSEYTKEGEYSMLSTVEFPIVEEEFSLLQKLKEEKTALQICLSGHPVEPVREQTGMLLDTSKLNSDMLNERINLLGVVTNLHMITTKKGQRMAMFNLDDEYGTLPAIVFPKSWNKLSDILLRLEEITPVLITGKLSQDKRKEESDEEGNPYYQLYVDQISYVTLEKRSIFALYESQTSKDSFLNASKKYPGMDVLYCVNCKDGNFEDVEKIPWEVDLNKLRRDSATRGIKILWHDKLTNSD